VDIESKPRNLGRAHLTGELRRRLGMSRRGAKRVLDVVIDEMKQALAADEPVEFPFGWLQRACKESPRYESILADEPMQPYKVKHFTDREGADLLQLRADERDCWSNFQPRAKTPPYTFRRRRPRGRQPVLNTDQIQRILAMTSEAPPAGQPRWTIRLIVEEAEKRNLAPKVGWETMRIALKNHDRDALREEKRVRRRHG
jgi:hypothetical protein